MLEQDEHKINHSLFC